MSAVSPGQPEQLLTIDELAHATGLTVRTTRYYVSLGLLPAPVRRGRMAWYGGQHLGRLELVRALQDHGFTLAAIERFLRGIPVEASAEELAVQRALLTAWRPGRWESVSRAVLDARAGRVLDEAELDWLVRAGAVRRAGEDFQVLPVLEQAVAVLDSRLPIEAVRDASAAVRRHMTGLADELSEILRTHVVDRYVRDDLSMEDAERLERTLTSLRTLTLEAIVSTFQHAANQLLTQPLRGGPE
jgi:DNA-binding transcriptional MerR regulator